MRYCKILTFSMILLGTVPLCRAERKYVLGTQLDFMGGVTNSFGGPNGGQTQALQKMFPYFSLFPTIDLRSEGRSSVFTVSYSFMWERMETEPKLTAAAHMANIGLDSRLSRNLHLRLKDSFYSTPDYRAYLVFKGIEDTGQDFVFVYDTLFSERASTSNNANAALDVDLTPHSSLTFEAFSSYRSYDLVSGPALGYLSDQLRTEGSLAYSHQTSRRQTWSMKYSVAEYEFAHFTNARNHSATVEISQELAPSLKFRLEAGPSYAQSPLLQTNRLGYVVEAEISKSLHSNMIRLSYSHRPMGTTGLGSMSDIDLGSLEFYRSLGRKVNLNFSVSGLNQKARVDNPVNARWYYSSAALSYAVTKHWLLVLGGSYRRNEQFLLFGSEYKRAYVSIRFRAPELWRGSR